MTDTQQVGRWKVLLATACLLSSAAHADKIKVPIFLAHGVQDGRVDVDHAHRMKAMLELHEVPLRWELMEDFGHGFPSTDDEKRYYLDLRDFLADHLRD